MQDFLFEIFLIIYSISVVICGIYFTLVSNRDIAKLSNAFIRNGLNKDKALTKANIVFYITAMVGIFLPVINSVPLIGLVYSLCKNSISLIRETFINDK